MTKSLILTLTLLSSAAFAETPMPELKKSGDFNNINDRKEYRYKIYPDLVFWYEHGRSYWRNKETAKSMMTSNLMKTIYFDRESSKLTSQSKKQLDKIADRINNKFDGEPIDKVVFIEGHASTPGTKKFNSKLSEKRANVVKEYLLGEGVSSKIIENIAFGEQFPKSSPDKSRRVEIEISSQIL